MMRELRRTLERHSFAAACVLAIVMCLAGTFQHGLWTPDEPREAEIGREMLMAHGSPLPMLDGEAFLEKPPFFPWVMALFYAVFGVHPGVARLTAALFSIGSILIAHELGRRAGGRLAGLLSALVLATTAKFADVSHSAVNDTALTFFVAAGHLGFLIARDRERRDEKTFGLIAAGLCAGLAFLTKSFIGPVLVAGPPLLAAALMREWRFLRFAVPRAVSWCTLFVSAFGLPWVLALANVAGWSAVRVCLVDNTLGRSVSAVPEFGHANGPLFYLGTFPLEALPWMIVLPAALFSASLGRDWRGGRTRYLAWAVLSGLAILSIPATKRGLYALPLYPAAAVVAGAWLSRAGSRSGSRFDRITLVGLLSLTAVVLIAASGALVWLGSGAAVPAKLQGSVLFLREHYGIGGVGEVGGIGRIGGSGASAARETAAGLAQESGSSSWWVIALIAGVAGLVVLARALRARSSPTPALARTSAVSVLAAFSIWLCGLQPFIDPLKDMSAGARTSVQDIPANEPLLGLALDETSRAIIPYYTDRFIRNVQTSEQALEALASGPSKHLVVMDNAEGRIDPNLRASLRPVSSKKLNAARALNVYRYEPKH